MAWFRGWAAGVALVCVAAGCGDGAPGKPLNATTRRRIDHYVANYARWSPESLEIARRQQLVITHDAERTLTRELVASIQAGVDPDDPSDDVIVLCYVSIGEDMRARAYGDVQMLTDARFRGDGSGPRMDPRGPDANGGSLDGIDPLGLASNGGTGFASYYLDDRDVRNSPNHVGDGLPDRNPLFGSLFVNAGDPSWFDIVDKMTLDGPDGLAGLAEVLTPNAGRGLNCDGVFLDTIDTAAPNSFTDHDSANQTEYEWTAPGFSAFIRRVRERYPDKLLLQNRGVFFFDPRHPHFRWNAQGAIDFILFESYRLDSDPSDEWNSIHYPDNRYQTMPKLMAAANRPDGFQVLSLGYAEGPPDRMSTATLLGQSSLGMQSLLEDIDVTQREAGFRHYLTDGRVTLVNDFVRAQASLDDPEPPHWSSTYNDHPGLPAGAPTPRVGVQQATGGGGRITVRWDVALDQNRVHYVLYAQPTPFDFAADPTLAGARRIPLDARCPDAYLDDVGPDRYPYEAVVADFPSGETQYLVLRAADDAGNEEANTVVLTAVP